MAAVQKFLHIYANANTDSVMDLVWYFISSYCVKEDKTMPALRHSLKDNVYLFYNEQHLSTWKSCQNPLLLQDFILICNKSDVIYKEAIDLIKKHHNLVIEILGEIVRNEYLASIKSSVFFKEAAAKDLITLSKTNEKWKFNISYNVEAMSRDDIKFEDKFNTLFFLLPVISKSDVVLEYTKKCAECNSFYQAKGEKSIFCSEKCRSRYRIRSAKNNKI